MFKSRVMALAALVSLTGAAQAAFLVTYEVPGATATTASFDYVGVETFDGRGTGLKTFTTNFGTGGNPVVISGQYSNVQINAVDVYGGANGSNSENRQTPLRQRGSLRRDHFCWNQRTARTEAASWMPVTRSSGISGKIPRMATSIP